MMMALNDLEPEPSLQEQGPSNDELVVALLRQHLHHHEHRRRVPAELVAQFEAAFPRHEQSVTSKSVLLQAFDLQHEERERSILDELVAQRRVHGAAGNAASDRKFDFIGDGTSVDVNGLIVSDATAMPFAAVARLDDLDIAHAAYLGRGASGSVMRVTHIPTGVVYAVKEIALTPDTIEHAQAEVAVVWGTSRDRAIETSPFLVQSYGVFYRDIRLYIVMELMACSVNDFLKRGPVPEDAVRGVVFQVLHALWFLHERRGQLHRDIKPHNWLANKHGICKLADFGISSKKLETVMFKKSSTFCGTLTYMSPLRASGEAYGYEGDLWSVGISVIELLLRQAPPVANVYHIIQFANAPPRLPSGSFSPGAEDFVATVLPVMGGQVPTAAQLLHHPWFAGLTVEAAAAAVAPIVQSLSA